MKREEDEQKKNDSKTAKMSRESRDVGAVPVCVPPLSLRCFRSGYAAYLHTHTRTEVFVSI